MGQPGEKGPAGYEGKKGRRGPDGLDATTLDVNVSQSLQMAQRIAADDYFMEMLSQGIDNDLNFALALHDMLWANQIFKDFISTAIGQSEKLLHSVAFQLVDRSTNMYYNDLPPGEIASVQESKDAYLKIGNFIYCNDNSTACDGSDLSTVPRTPKSVMVLGNNLQIGGLASGPNVGNLKMGNGSFYQTSDGNLAISNGGTTSIMKQNGDFLIPLLGFQIDDATSNNPRGTQWLIQGSDSEMEIKRKTQAEVSVMKITEQKAAVNTDQVSKFTMQLLNSTISNLRMTGRTDGSLITIGSLNVLDQPHITSSSLDIPNSTGSLYIGDWFLNSNGTSPTQSIKLQFNLKESEHLSKPIMVIENPNTNSGSATRLILTNAGSNVQLNNQWKIATDNNAKLGSSTNTIAFQKEKNGEYRTQFAVTTEGLPWTERNNFIQENFKEGTFTRNVCYFGKSNNIVGAHLK